MKGTMRLVLLSIIISAALAVSATAQECCATIGMTLTDVIAICGQPASVDHLYTHPEMMIAAWGEPASVDRHGGESERWYMKKGSLIIFDVNGTVAGIQNF